LKRFHDADGANSLPVAATRSDAPGPSRIVAPLSRIVALLSRIVALFSRIVALFSRRTAGAAFS
jgi:hypothetical protein